MIIVFIFFLHIVLVGFVLYKKTKMESFGSALIDLTLIIILFSVGWSLSAMLVKLFFEPEGFGKFFDRDTIALSILAVVEFFFYKFYFKDLFTTSSGKGK
jgi:hypothetical protein